jgi:hypothetical protein
MFGYNSPFFDFLRQRDREATNDPNAMTPAFDGASPAYVPWGGDSGSPAGDMGGLMGGGDSLAKGASGWTKDQMSGGMMAAKGLGTAVNALTGGDQKPIQAPRIDDNSGQVRQQAAQMWQQMMQKKQPRGLI